MLNILIARERIPRSTLPKVGGWENDTGGETGLRADTGKLSRGDAKKR